MSENYESNKMTMSLKAARIENGYTQESLAKKLKVSPRTVFGWESGEMKVKPQTLYALAYLYGMKAEQIRLPELKQK